MEKIIDKILKTINEYIKESDDEIRLFKVMLSIFNIYYGDSYKGFKKYKSLHEISIEDQKKIEKELMNHSLQNKEIELYKFGLKFDKLIEGTNRAKTGSFYTPEYLARDIILLTLSDYFKQKDVKLHYFFKNYSNEKKENISILKLAYEEISKLTVADLSSGTGMFLLSFLNIVIELGLKIMDADSTFMLESFDVDQIFAFDIQKNPLDILELSILDLVFRYDFLSTNKLNIFCIDTLKESNENILNTDILKNGFDLILGNPPYIGEKGNMDLFKTIKESEFGKSFYEGKMDYFYYFIYKGLSLLKKDGVLGYITTNYFVSADGAFKLRKYLKEKAHFLSIVNFNDLIIFPSAPGQHNMIFTLTSGNNTLYNVTNISVISRENSQNEYNTLDYIMKFGYDLDIDLLFDSNGKITLTKDKSYHEIIEAIIAKSNMKIGDFISVKQGIVSGADKVSKLMLENKLSKENILNYSIKKDDSIFVIDSNDIVEIEEGFLKPFYKNSCINRYFTNEETNKQIIYINEKIDDFEENYPKTYKHLSKFKEVLDERREVKKGMKDWYLLQWGRSQEVFTKQRIVAPQRSKVNKFALCNENFYGSADIYYLYINNNMQINDEDLNYYLLGILNSTLYYFWLYNMGKRKGDLLELYSKPISQIPIVLFKNNFFESVIELVKEIFSINNSKIDAYNKTSRIVEAQKKLDEIIYNEYAIDYKKIKKIEELFLKNTSKDKK